MSFKSNGARQAASTSDRSTSVSDSTYDSVLPAYVAASQQGPKNKNLYPVRGSPGALRAIGFKIERGKDGTPDKITLLPKYDDGKDIRIDEADLNDCEKTGITKCYTFNRGETDKPISGLNFYFSTKFILAQEEIDKKLTGIGNKFGTGLVLVQLGQLRNINKSITPVFAESSKSVIPAPRNRIFGTKGKYDVVDKFTEMVDVISVKATKSKSQDEKDKASFERFLNSTKNAFIKDERDKLKLKRDHLEKFIAAQSKASSENSELKSVLKKDLPTGESEDDIIQDIELHQIYDKLIEESTIAQDNPQNGITKRVRSLLNRFKGGKPSKDKRKTQKRRK